MKRLMVAGVMATATIALSDLGIAPAHADAMEVDGNYATLADCQADGPQTRATQNGGSYAHWSCHKGEDGLYYMYLSN